MSEEKRSQNMEAVKPDEKQVKGQELSEKELSPTWAQECIEDIDDWIESQGIYLRQ